MSPGTGRPRDESVDSRVVEAALHLVHQEGLAGVSIQGIANRAGVSKASIYRRWDSKDELLVDAVACMVEALDRPDSGDIRTDLVAAASGMRGFVSDTRAGEVLPWLLGQIALGTAVGQRYATEVIRPRRAMIAGLISDAMQRGELRADIDLETAVDMITGPVIMRRLVTGFEGTPESWTADLVDCLLTSWRV